MPGEPGLPHPFLIPPRGSHRLRTGRISRPGACYFVTTRFARGRNLLWEDFISRQQSSPMPTRTNPDRRGVCPHKSGLHPRGTTLPPGVGGVCPPPTAPFNAGGGQPRLSAHRGCPPSRDHNSSAGGQTPPTSGGPSSPDFSRPTLHPAEVIIQSIQWLESKGSWTVHCFVLMPDHLHLVFTLDAEEPLSGLLHSFKRHTGVTVNRLLGRKGPFWQDGYFDHRLRTDERLEWTAFYCLRNPVNAGLVSRASDWPWFDCKPALRERMDSQLDEFLSLEAERKSWSPPRSEMSPGCSGRGLSPDARSVVQGRGQPRSPVWEGFVP